MLLWRQPTGWGQYFEAWGAGMVQTQSYACSVCNADIISVIYIVPQEVLLKLGLS